MKAVTDNDPDVGQTAWTALPQVDRSWQQSDSARDGVVEVVARLTVGDNPRAAVLKVIAAMGGSAAAAVPPLVARLGHTEWKVRLSAAVALGMIGPVAIAAISRLQMARTDMDSDVRTAAAAAVKLIAG